MKSLQFIYYSEAEISQLKDEKLQKTIRAFQTQGKKFNQKYSLLSNKELQQTFRQTYPKSSVYPKRWSTKSFNFKELFLELCKNVCPICSKDVDIMDDIDHYRPKSHYWWLTYNYENYLLLCSECDRILKNTAFPLFDETKRVSNIEHHHKITEEQPLLINPLLEDPTPYFWIFFLTKNSYFLLAPHIELDENTYEYKKASTTIELYDLNYIKANSSRKSLIRKHYNPLFELAEAVQKCKGQLLSQKEFESIVLRQQQTLADSWVSIILANQFTIQ